MGFLEDFQASIESLPAMLQRNYALMRDLDESLQGVQRQNEQRCEQEIEDIRRKVEGGVITPDTPDIRFSDEAVDEQRHCVRIADEKVALAMQTYDLVDAHIQQLDQYMRKLEELRQERQPTATSGGSNQNTDASTKSGKGSEGGRGGRKKTKLAPATAAPADPPHIDLELPVDPNEPTYCFCNQVSYGEMVACDNPDCKIEWFHFGCVGLKEQPRGKWYCTNCAGMQKRRKSR